MTRAVRRRPYVDVTRAKCVRCGAKAAYSWHGCALGPHVYVAICKRCDAGLNAVALRYLRVADWRGKMKAYSAQR